jgi:hypothetical protein
VRYSLAAAIFFGGGGSGWRCGGRTRIGGPGVGPLSIQSHELVISFTARTGGRACL